MTDLDSKDIYLKKGTQIVGLHAIGHKEEYQTQVQHLDGTFETVNMDFMELEKWGNRYDENLNMIGGSFRIHDLSIDDTEQAYLEDGWVRFTPEEK